MFVLGTPHSNSNSKRPHDDALRQDDRPEKIPRLFQPTVKPLSDSSPEDLNLIQLLDFTTLSSQDQISARFDQIAEALLHDYCLCVSVPTEQSTLLAPGESTVKEFKFNILELEFYLRKEGRHEDPFAHASEEQRVMGNWYFHRAPRRSEDSSRSATSLTGYRGGTRKGLDLTLGVPKTRSSPDTSLASGQPSLTGGSAHEVRGGVLLRTIKSIPLKGETAKVVSGPSLLVDEILRLSRAASIKELVQITWDHDTSAFSSSNTVRPSLYLKKTHSGSPATTKVPVYKSPRIGLELSHPGTTADLVHPRVVFVAKQYRYFVHPELLTKNGRPQTFLGVRSAIIKSGQTNEMGDNDELSARIARLTSMKAPLVKKLLEEYEQGRIKGKLESFVGSKGKGVASQPAVYMRMIGLLSRE